MVSDGDHDLCVFLHGLKASFYANGKLVGEGCQLWGDVHRFQAALRSRVCGVPRLVLTGPYRPKEKYLPLDTLSCRSAA